MGGDSDDGVPGRLAAAVDVARRRWGAVLALAVASILPLVVRESFSRNLLVLAVVYGIAAVSLNLIMGLMGQFSFGHAALWGVGGYVSGRLALNAGLSPWIAIPAGALAAGLLGAAVGAVALRKTRGLELAIVTLGFGAIAWILALRWAWFGGGMSGISGVPGLSLFGAPLSTPVRFYYFALLMLAIVLWGVTKFETSRAGRAVVSVRENEPLAASIGVAPFRYYLMAFALASGLAGFSGALYAHYQGFLNPSMLSLPIMIMLLMMVLLGGTGRVWGPVLGAGVYVWITDLLSFNEELQLLLFGLLVVVVVRFMPDGLSALVVRADSSRRAYRSRFGGGGQGCSPVADVRPLAPSPGSHDAVTLLPRRTVPDGAGGVVLRTERLRCEFGGLVAVKDLDLSVRRGEILGLIGPNGSGKTTTINMLSGFLKPSAGRILLDDVDITAQAPHRVAQRGLVRSFQLSNVYGTLSVHENVVHSSHLSAQRTSARALSQASRRRVADHAGALLDFVGLHHRSSTPAKDLSAGERRYLEIANALAARPPTLLLDEPASGLNTQEASRLTDLVEAIRQAGTTVVIVEHNMRVIMRVCDRVFVLNRGEYLADGAPAEISRDERVITAYLGRSGSGFAGV